MKLRIASDFHLEFLTNRKPAGPAGGRDTNSEQCLEATNGEQEQVLLLAGDILCAGKDFSEWESFFKNLHSRFHSIYIIMGNHEHYKHDFLETFDVLETFYNKVKRVYLLDNDWVVLDDDTALFGATLWTDCNKRSPMTMLQVEQAMADYKIISYGEEAFTTTIAADEFDKTMKELREFQKLPYKNKIVMTHHAPSFQSTAEIYKGDPINPGFGSDLDDYIAKSNISLWVHGHMHNSSDYMIGNTRIICNPRGYGTENISNYNPNLVIDTDDL